MANKYRDDYISIWVSKRSKNILLEFLKDYPEYKMSPFASKAIEEKVAEERAIRIENDSPTQQESKT